MAHEDLSPEDYLAKLAADRRYVRAAHEADLGKPSGALPVQSDGGSTAYYLLPAHARDIDDLIAHKRMSFRMGNVFKAAYRMGEKAGIDRAYDLRKIIFNAQRELEDIEAGRV